MAETTIDRMNQNINQVNEIFQEYSKTKEELSSLINDGKKKIELHEKVYSELISKLIHDCDYLIDETKKILSEKENEINSKIQKNKDKINVLDEESQELKEEINREIENNRKLAEEEIKKANKLLNQYYSVEYETQDNQLRFIIGIVYEDFKVNIYNYVKKMEESFNKELYQSVIGMSHQLFFMTKVRENEVLSSIMLSKKYIQSLLNNLKQINCVLSKFHKPNNSKDINSVYKYYNLSDGNCIPDEVINFWTDNQYEGYIKNKNQIEIYLSNFVYFDNLNDEKVEEKDYIKKIRDNIYLNENKNIEIINTIISGCGKLYELSLHAQSDLLKLECLYSKYIEELCLFNTRLCCANIITELLMKYSYQVCKTDNSEKIDIRNGINLLFSYEEIIVEVCVIKTYCNGKQEYSNQIVLALDMNDPDYEDNKNGIIAIIEEEPILCMECIEFDFDLSEDRHSKMIKTVFNYMNVR